MTKQNTLGSFSLLISLLRVAGVILMISVGYHYINSDIGYSIAGSIAVFTFGLCLVALYQGYQFDTSTLLGWGAILLGVTILALQTVWSVWIIIALISLIGGYFFARLPIEFISSNSGVSSDGGGFDGGGGDGC